MVNQNVETEQLEERATACLVLQVALVLMLNHWCNATDDSLADVLDITSNKVCVDAILIQAGI